MKFTLVFVALFALVAISTAFPAAEPEAVADPDPATITVCAPSSCSGSCDSGCSNCNSGCGSSSCPTCYTSSSDCGCTSNNCGCGSSGSSGKRIRRSYIVVKPKRCRRSYGSYGCGLSDCSSCGSDCSSCGSSKCSC